MIVGLSQLTDEQFHSEGFSGCRSSSDVMKTRGTYFALRYLVMVWLSTASSVVESTCTESVEAIVDVFRCS